MASTGWINAKMISQTKNLSMILSQLKVGDSLYRGANVNSDGVHNAGQ